MYIISLVNLYFWKKNEIKKDRSRDRSEHRLQIRRQNLSVVTFYDTFTFLSFVIFFKIKRSKIFKSRSLIDFADRFETSTYVLISLCKYHFCVFIYVREKPRIVLVCSLSARIIIVNFSLIYSNRAEQNILLFQFVTRLFLYSFFFNIQSNGIIISFPRLSASNLNKHDVEVVT